MVKVGDKFEYVGEQTEFYTPNKVYTATGDKRDFDFRFPMTDDRGADHWWSDEAMKEKFKPVQQGPIREVRRREIVPGVYGLVEIDNVTKDDGISIWLPRNKRWWADELREAAHLFNQLAEVLEEQS